MTRLKILITGAKGQVGWELQRTMSTLGSITAIDREELDLANFDEVRRFVRELRPGLIVNAAAYTAVDLAESQPDVAHLLNAEVPRVLAEEARDLRVPFLTYSTDYVFDGTADQPYTEDSKPNPISAYGRSKLAGDCAVQKVGGAFLILRTAWVYGARGKNFLLTMLRLAKERSELRVVDDQVGSPTWCRSIAEATAKVVTQGVESGTGLFEFVEKNRGIYNVVATGSTSWFGFTQAILERVRSNAKVTPISSSEYPTPAKRPKFSILSTDKLQQTFGIVMPNWKAALGQVELPK
jgi:dTDP-4-dehydrorhamnose reductase